MDRERFEELVTQAINNLPEEFRSRLENVEVLVDDYPSPGQLRRSHIKPGQTLLGLYEGIPQTHRSIGYNLVLPDKITIFQKTIEAKCRNDEEITITIKNVVEHEIAHHFGISDERLEELGR